MSPASPPLTAQAQDSEPTTPVVAFSLGRVILGYTVDIGMSSLITLSLLEVHGPEQLSIPFTYQTDGLYCLTLVNTIEETGWYYYNERIGQLGGLEYRD